MCDQKTIVRLHSACCKGNHSDGMFNICNWYYETDDNAGWGMKDHKLWSEKVAKLIDSGKTEAELIAILDARDEFREIEKSLGK